MLAFKDWTCEVPLTCAFNHAIIFYVKSKEEDVESIISRQVGEGRVDNF